MKLEKFQKPVFINTFTWFIPAAKVVVVDALCVCTCTL